MDKVWKNRLNSLKRGFKPGKADLIVLYETLIASIFCFAARPECQAVIQFLVKMS